MMDDDHILYSERMLSFYGEKNSKIELLLYFVGDSFIVSACFLPEKQACDRAFSSYELARACFMDALLVMSTKTVDVEKVKRTLLKPPFHPELY